MYHLLAYAPKRFSVRGGRLFFCTLLSLGWVVLAASSQAATDGIDRSTTFAHPLLADEPLPASTTPSAVSDDPSAYAIGPAANGYPSTALYNQPDPEPSAPVELVGYMQKKNGGGLLSAAGCKVTPYGAFWGDMIYATSRTAPGAYTLYVPSESVEGEDAFTIDMRRSRFGLKMDGPKIEGLNNASSKARVEIDFQGSFVTENKAGVLLRHAYWEVGDERFRLLVGQTSDVISPLVPSTLNYSVGWLGGNIGYRRAQFRAERYWQWSDSAVIGLQGSLNQDIVSDFATTAGVGRESTNWPVIEARTSIMWDNCLGGKPPEFGISGHIGETGFDLPANGLLPPADLPPEDDARFRTWSINADLYLPITERFGVQGEFFHGENLSSFLGGIGQGVCPCLRVPIRATGGWVDMWYDWTDRLHSHVGYGVDDPDDADSLVGRTYNQFIFANVTYDVTKNLLTGFEVTSWKTLYQEERAGLVPPADLTTPTPGESVVLQWMVKYGF